MTTRQYRGIKKRKLEYDNTAYRPAGSVGFFVRRVAVFIDAAYLKFVLKYRFGCAQIDYAKLSKRCARDMELVGTYHYDCLPFVGKPSHPDDHRKRREAERFYRHLRSIPDYHIRLGRLAFRGLREDGSRILVQKRVDVLLAMDFLDLVLTGRITDAALVAGDSDFIPLVERAHQAGVKVGLWYGSGYGVDSSGRKRNVGAHGQLVAACDEAVELDQRTIDDIRF